MAQPFRLTDDDRERMGQIRDMKRTAGLVLLAATVVFVVARLLEDRSPVWSYVRATAEAAMVGGVADWFAVTALFRHPLGIPIPHTAILPHRKDQLGRTFGSFVQTSFLAPDVLAERLTTISVSDRLAAWLGDDDNARLVAAKGGSLATTALRLLDDDAVADFLATDVLGRFSDVDVAPLVAELLETATEDGRHHRLFDAALDRFADLLVEQKPVLRARFESESPWWVPGSLDDRVFDRIFGALHAFVGEVRANPRHELRRHVDAQLADHVERLRTSPAAAARVDDLAAELLAHPQLRAWAVDAWAGARDRFVEQVADPGSALSLRIADGARALGNALATDDELRTRVDRAATEIAVTLAEHYGDDIAHFVETTVQRWDATETSTRVELLLGRDLQIIRINGSVVGGLVGLVIFTIGRLLG